MVKETREREGGERRSTSHTSFAHRAIQMALLACLLGPCTCIACKMPTSTKRMFLAQDGRSSPPPQLLPIFSLPSMPSDRHPVPDEVVPHPDGQDEAVGGRVPGRPRREQLPRRRRVPGCLRLPRVQRPPRGADNTDKYPLHDGVAYMSEWYVCVNATSTRTLFSDNLSVVGWRRY